MNAQQPPDDPADFGALYDRYVECLYRFIYSRVHDRSLAEDLTEEVFLKALKNIESFHHRGLGVGPWLYRIAANTIVDHYRDAGRSHDMQSKLHGGQPADDVLELVVRRDQLRRVHRAINQLPAQQRRAMTLRFSRDLPLNEVAHLMNKSSAAVKLLVYRAVQHLRRDLVLMEG
jgi:RNA polymerase sigma-70 factor (ECF subfamily)